MQARQSGLARTKIDDTSSTPTGPQTGLRFNQKAGIATRPAAYWAAREDIASVEKEKAKRLLRSGSRNIMTTFLNKIPFWVDIVALVISGPVVLAFLIEAVTPFQVRVHKRKISAKHRAGALVLVAAFLTIMVAAAGSLPRPQGHVNLLPHLAFAEPGAAADGGPVRVSCRASLVVRGYVPPGYAPAVASIQSHTTVLYFESALVPGPRSDEWSGSVTLGNASSKGDLYTLYAMAVPEEWESYLVKAVNWQRPGATDWAESSLPPHSGTIADALVIQDNSDC